MNGLDFLWFVKKRHPNPIRILISAYAEEDVVMKAKASGIDEVINKPFTGEVIENALVRLAEFSRAWPAPTEYGRSKFECQPMDF